MTSGSTSQTPALRSQLNMIATSKRLKYYIFRRLKNMTYSLHQSQQPDIRWLHRCNQVRTELYS